MNRLWGMRCYLIGAIDKANDLGVGWRTEIIPFLENLGVVIFNPLDKPIDLGSEDIQSRIHRDKLRKNECYTEFSSDVKQIRLVDLRMVDFSDFLICYLDMDVPTCGTWEELTWANRIKRPILTVVKQGKKDCYNWLFGTIPHEHIFSSFPELQSYLINVDLGVDTRTFNRWMFFHYEKLVPKVPKRNNSQNSLL